MLLPFDADQLLTAISTMAVGLSQRVLLASRSNKPRLPAFSGNRSRLRGVVAVNLTTTGRVRQRDHFGP
jgi:hypothetical protein